MKRPLIVHPFFFAVFPVLSLYLVNIKSIGFDAVVRPMIILLTAAGLLVLLFRLVSRKWRRAALAASLVIVLFTSYGHLYVAIRRALPTTIFAKANVVMAIWAAVLILGVWVILRLVKRTVKVTQVLNVVSILLVASTVATAPLSGSGAAGQVRLTNPPDLTLKPGPNWDGTKPDIYYIILDAYGGQDTLRDLYGIDNTPFLNGLRDRGFTVADDSKSNYWRTLHSVPSSLNFHYLDDLIEPGQNLEQYRIGKALISNSAARRFLEGLGYQTIAFSTGYEFSEIRDANVYYKSQRPYTPFEKHLLMGSMAAYWVDWAVPVYHRVEVLQHFKDLKETAAIKGPKFVFAHMVVPHVPFVFDADGNPVAPVSAMDGNAYSGTVDHYKMSYSGQLLYTNRLAMDAIDTILAQSETPPIIIVQGDHGPKAYLNWQSIEQSCIRELFPILNAYYLPGKPEAAAAIPQDITPVNTFRMLFNTYFDTRLPMEANRHYATDDWDVTKFVDLTDRLDWCPAVDAVSTTPNMDK